MEVKDVIRIVTTRIRKDECIFDMSDFKFVLWRLLVSSFHLVDACFNGIRECVKYFHLQ